MLGVKLASVLVLVSYDKKEDGWAGKILTESAGFNCPFWVEGFEILPRLLVDMRISWESRVKIITKYQVRDFQLIPLDTGSYWLLYTFEKK